ncbi:MAG TPA: phospholipase D-like domain-containing protein [Longimicrobiales bacterium]|nr:phospholipase D-like domain-containing protein [Longimicrobiales bacterium]
MKAAVESAQTHVERPGPDLPRSLVDQAFTRASGAELIEGNSVRLLRDAAENYPAWLEAIASARRSIYFESYIIRDDASGRQFADALTARARDGVPVRLIYDWMGALGKTSPGFWTDLREGGVDVRCFNPFRFSSPLGWVRRNHRKSLIVDGEVGFITGLCVGDAWVGDPARGIEPWRDTGIEVRGPAVAEIEQAFVRMWSLTGTPIPKGERRGRRPAPAGDVALRVVASEPSRGSLLRVDELVAAAARSTLWLTDAYFAGIPSYVQALRAAAMDGVDVRLLVPGGTDIPVLRPISQAGFRPLLEGGVRVFEWNGPMLHSKSAVADGRWARIGSTNLNVASWVGNYELDALIEDESFARLLEAQFIEDLSNTTEILLSTRRRRVFHRRREGRGSDDRHGDHRHRARDRRVPGRGSAGRAAAGAIRLGNTVAAAVGNRRVLAGTEARIVAALGALFAIAAAVALFWPRLIAWPLALVLAWFAVVLLGRAYRLHRGRRRPVEK